MRRPGAGDEAAEASDEAPSSSAGEQQLPPTGRSVPGLSPMTARIDARIPWQSGTHERRVENFYSRGADSFGDCHGGYLNFGLWEPGFTYLQAAENLVSHLGAWGGLDSASRLLDVGCGFGAQDILLARKFGPAQITGIDVTWPHVRAAQHRAKVAGLSMEVRFQHGSATELSFPDGTFTHVLSIEGVVHFNTREQFLRQASRVLQPGGVLLLADYALARKPVQRLDKLFLRAACKGWQVPDENVDTLESYQEKVERSGFTQVEVVSAGDRTIPQYFHEQTQTAHLASMFRIRGPLAAAGGLAIDWFAWQAWKRGQLDYVLVRAVKR